MTPTPVPSVNRAVHYVAYGTPGGEYPMACRAATITEVGAWTDVAVETDGAQRTVHQQWDPAACALTVLNPTGLFMNPRIPFDHGHDPSSTERSLCDGRAHRGGTWHWAAIR